MGGEKGHRRFFLGEKKGTGVSFFGFKEAGGDGSPARSFPRVQAVPPAAPSPQIASQDPPIPAGAAVARGAVGVPWADMLFFEAGCSVAMRTAVGAEGTQSREEMAQAGGCWAPRRGGYGASQALGTGTGTRDVPWAWFKSRSRWWCGDPKASGAHGAVFPPQHRLPKIPRLSRSRAFPSVPWAKRLVWSTGALTMGQENAGASPSKIPGGLIPSLWLGWGRRCGVGEEWVTRGASRGRFKL